MATVLLTGGTGLVGRRLTELLLRQGYEVRNLSRNGKAPSGARGFECDWKRKKLDKRALIGVDYLVHLAGAGVADKPWTDERKLEIMASRTQLLQFIYETWQEQGFKWPDAVVSASGMSYYGIQSGDRLRTEDDSAGDHFLSQVCIQWEESLMPFEKEGVRTASLRISLVLSKDGGALAAMASPVRWGLGVPLGNGKQWMSWIHIEDLCRMFQHIIQHQNLKGPYNAATPHPIRHRTFMIHLGKALNRVIWPIPVPSFLLRWALGERAELLLQGEPMNTEKILSTGFNYRFPEIASAFADIFNSPSH